jgi:anti-anti-sigma regulatory factor
MDKIAITVRDQTNEERRGHRARVVGVVGPITHRTTLTLRDFLRSAVHPPDQSPRLLLDLSCCTTVDVDGLLALKVIQEEIRDHGGELHVIRVPPLIARQIEQHNFQDLMPDPAPAEHQE